jgi:chromosomal replication initiation ATPase DnaA
MNAYEFQTNRLPINHIFDNLILYSGNRFAYTATVCVAEAPGKAFNPLFLYGPTGNGKTHLMQAIGNKIKSERVDQNIVFITAHQFRSFYIESIGGNCTADFYKYFKSADVLLLDDLDLLSGLEQTQEALFHIFNDLHSRGKQMVFASVYHPQKLKWFDRRLSSRLTWGLITDIQAPSAAEFLQKYSSINQIQLTTEITQKIMNQEYSSAADLLGVLRQCLTIQEWEDTMEMEYQAGEHKGDFWKAVLAEIAKELSDSSFETWFRPTSAILDGDTLKIYAPNHFSADWMEFRYKQNLSGAVERVLGKRPILQFIGLEGQSFMREPVVFQQDLESPIPDLEQERNCEQEWTKVLGELRELKQLAKDSILERQKTNALLEEILRRL